MAMGADTLRAVFDETYYQDLSGGILEAMGRLFKRNVKLYVYPFLDPATGEVLTAENLEVPAAIRTLYGYLRDRGAIQDLESYNPELLSIRAPEVLKLIRAYLNAGVMDHGLEKPTVEGTPQGGPLSPLLSNIVLDELDRELERRGHRFVRYADDCTIYVRSERAGKRVMESVTRFIERKLKLKVNRTKSAVGRPWKRKLLGFSFTNGKEPKRRIAPEALSRFKKRVRELTRRSRSISAEQRVAQLRPYLLGWRSYFGFAQTPSVLEALDFVREMRAALGPQRLLVVCPVGWDKAGRPVAPAEAQLQQWQRRLRSTGDRALAVRPWPGGPAE